MHVDWHDTWTLGIAWRRESLYGVGGFEVLVGPWIVCFYKREQSE